MNSTGLFGKISDVAINAVARTFILAGTELGYMHAVLLLATQRLS
jgi:hypothetical protein